MKKILFIFSLSLFFGYKAHSQNATVNISGEATPIPNQFYSYLATSVEGARNYRWEIVGTSGDFDDTATGICNDCGRSVNIRWYNHNITILLKLDVYGIGPEVIASDYFYVTPKYLGTPTISPTNVPCGVTPTFTANNATNADVYTWTFQSNTYEIRGSNQFTPPSFPVGSNESVSVTVTRDDAQGFSVSSTAQITRPRPQKPSFTQFQKGLCPNESATFSASGVNAETYVWTTTGGVQVNGQTTFEGGSSVTVSATSSGTVSVSSKSLSCQMTSSPVTQEIHYGPPNVSLDAQTTSNYVHVNVINNNTGSPISQNKQDITSVSWQKLSSSGSCQPYLTTSSFMAVADGPCQDWSMDIRVDVHNACGTITLFETLYAEGCTQSSYQLRKTAS